MSGAKGGEENIAAASAATVQQAGIALGAAIAGLGITAGLTSSIAVSSEGISEGSAYKRSCFA